MPLYEYQCPKCGNVFELIRLFAQAEAPAPCPTCGGSAKRLFSNFAFGYSYGLRLSADKPLRAPVVVKAARKKAALPKKTAAVNKPVAKKKVVAKAVVKRPAKPALKAKKAVAKAVAKKRAVKRSVVGRKR